MKSKTAKKSKPVSRKKNRAPKNKKRRFLKILIKAHSFATATIIILYLVFGLSLNPTFLLEDLQNKYAWAASGTVNVSLWIPGPPGKTSVTATTGCNNSYPGVSLSWNSTTDTESYDIYRNGEPLITGLLSSPYRDDNVQAGVSYSYYIVANGPLGHTRSDEISAAPFGCYTPPPPSPPPPPPPPPPPVIEPATLNGKNISCLTKYTKTSAKSSVPIAYSNNRRPVFSGTTNIADAKIKIMLVWKKTIIISSFLANDNGYWKWQPPKKLKKRNYTLYISAVSPNDPSQKTETFVNFTVRPGKKIKETCTSEKVKFVSPLYPKPLSALSLEIFPQNGGEKFVNSGQILGEQIAISPQDNSSFINNGPVSFVITGPQDKIILSAAEFLPANSSQPILKNFSIPRFTPSGRYRLLARAVSADGTLFTAENLFSVKESPLISLGGNISLTYTEILAKLGWFAAILSLILALLIFLLLGEYLVSSRLKLQITGEELKRDGFIS